MRKDVEDLRRIYCPVGEDGRTDVEVLRWPNATDMVSRYEAMLSPLDFEAYSTEAPLRLLDVGCGLGLLLDWLAENQLLDRVDYTGVELSQPMFDAVTKRWPDQRFHFRDIRDQPYPESSFDFCIVCGIFTVNNGNSYEDTVALAQEVLKSAWGSVTFGLAFNSMSKHVDWERDDLFHWPLDDIMAFCKRDLSRHVSFKLDYGLWEASTIVRKRPLQASSKKPERW